MDQLITTKEQFQEILQDVPEFFLLKHSLTCPISAAANHEYNTFKKETDLPCYTLFVQESRELSNRIAEQFSVKHESPQVLYFKEKQVIYHESHGGITRNKLQDRAMS